MNFEDIIEIVNGYGYRKNPEKFIGIFERVTETKILKNYLNEDQKKAYKFLVEFGKYKYKSIGRISAKIANGNQYYLNELKTYYLQRERERERERTTIYILNIKLFNNENTRIKKPYGNETTHIGV